jgi:hypothetical protein
VIVGDDGWLWLVLVRSAVSREGGGGVGVWRWWRGGGTWLPMVLNGGVPYFPV